MSKIPDRVLNTFWRWGNESVRLRLELRDAQKEIAALKAENQQLKSVFNVLHNQIEEEILKRADLNTENERLKTERDAAVDCIEDISYQNRKFSANWIDEIINEWRGIEETP